MSLDSPENIGRAGYGPYDLRPRRISRACWTDDLGEREHEHCSGCDCACHGEEDEP